MALKYEQFPLSLWESWSRRDMARFHDGECACKWASFRKSSGACVTGATLVKMARDRGYSDPDEVWTLDTPISIVQADEELPRRMESVPALPRDGRDSPLTEPPDPWDGLGETKTFLSRLFRPGEFVGYSMRSYQHKHRYIPRGRGVYFRTQEDILQSIDTYDDIEKALGTYDPLAGAWVRINPLDGKGIRNENVSEYRYTLVESDELSLQQQLSWIRSLRLPTVALVNSAGKSIHAVVHIDAGHDPDLYSRRVDYLYQYCRRQGFIVDMQNKNPSRLMRLPGIWRSGHKQYLIPFTPGTRTFDEWYEYAENSRDNLPPLQRLSAVWDDLPPLRPVLIEGLLRRGHKMMVAGPSKAGKSFALIELCISIAEGRRWMDTYQCARGQVLYINFELDEHSCYHRFADIYKAMGITEPRTDQIVLWNLRGYSESLATLLPKLLRRIHHEDFAAIVLDPIYKITDGDENSAHDMGIFCNQLDRLSTQKQCAVIYCHHYSKGSQNVKKAQDRASGSGVFSRDADAILDMLDVKSPIGAPPAFRIEAILREFASPPPFYITFDYPVHHIDTTGEIAAWNEDLDDLGRGRECMLSEKKRKCLSNQQLMRKLYDEIKEENQYVRIIDLMKAMNLSRNTIRAYIDESDDLERDENGYVHINKRKKRK